ncbi:unnamed protein product [Orchesella dallaii]|uniref:BHLH domain-containing protein n=1 Tax=Orchesella dallaii TaxID=48710 RepID=A0ABP1QZT7_9HEXA
MGLETLLEAAKFLEYQAEVEARGEKGFPDLPSNSTSSVAVVPSSQQNGYTNNNHHGTITNGIHYMSQTSHHHPFQKTNGNHNIGNTVGIPRVPEPVNGYKVSDHSYRRVNSLSQSPTLEFNGGTNRTKSNSNSSSTSSSNGSVSSRNSGTREVHNKLEKNRRAHLKECFELLKSQLPTFEDRKISNLAILRSSLRHIQNLKRKEREYEHEMERLAREKISLQQKIASLKKDMLGKWDHVDWQSIVPDDVDIGMESSNGPVSNAVTIENRRYSHNSESHSSVDVIQLKSESELDDSADSQHHPLSLTVNNCHTAEKVSGKKVLGRVNGVNGVSAGGPISLVTATKLSSSPLAAITVEKTANSPIGGASYVNTAGNNSTGFSVLNNATLAMNSNMDVGQYYEEEKFCK